MSESYTIRELVKWPAAQQAKAYTPSGPPKAGQCSN